MGASFSDRFYIAAPQGVAVKLSDMLSSAQIIPSGVVHTGDEAVRAAKELLDSDLAVNAQDAVNAAGAFDEALGIDGVVLTKLDGDARGGAALSVRSVTNKPIKYIGMGEKMEDLEPFYPDRMASRILGMGDVLSLIDKVQANIDEQEALDMA